MGLLFLFYEKRITIDPLLARQVSQISTNFFIMSLQKPNNNPTLTGLFSLFYQLIRYNIRTPTEFIAP